CVDAFELVEPVVVAAVLPGADVVLVQALAVLAETVDDFAVGGAVQEHEIDFVADVFGAGVDETGGPVAGGRGGTRGGLGGRGRGLAGLRRRVRGRFDGVHTTAEFSFQCSVFSAERGTNRGRDKVGDKWRTIYGCVRRRGRGRLRFG